MDYFPIFLNIRNRPCAVIGGGSVAARKVFLLLAAGGKVNITAPCLCTELLSRKNSGEINHREFTYSIEALEGATLVFAATNDRTLNATISRDAQARALPVNVVDDPEHCSFIMPAIIDRSPVMIAVSSGGSSPVLARLTRARLESFLPERYGQLALLAERFRQRVKEVLPPELRRAFWERALQGPVADLTLAGHIDEAEEKLTALIHTSDPTAITQGEVYLLATGTGDPDLLTFAALRLMQQADIALFDAQVSPAILNLVRRDAERIEVTPLNQQIFAMAKEGKRILRLRVGNPYLFGHDDEEITALNKEGIPWRMAPSANNLQTACVQNK